ncbi:MMPL family transporter [Fodinicola feengrottensis]|uniref:MMPL family transporter n=1 Tax=Fodinicola feengrottensis TaxID=435914 RepID=UPI0028BDD940|nr:MMPL family transporter [Fodinicola feengrottensis]
MEKWISVNSATSAMILLIGIAVGVDYTLFSLRRYREERSAGRTANDASRITASTSGRVVLVSGLTVMLCLTGLLCTGLDNFRGLTVGAVLVVGLSLTGAVIALPALLAALGPWVDRLRVPWLGRWRTHARPSRLWSATARKVTRRPVVWAVVGALTLAALALPALGMRLHDPAATDSLPHSTPAVAAALRVQTAFPGVLTPAKVVVSGPAQGAQILAALNAEVADSGGLLAEPVIATKVGGVLVVRVPLAGTGADAVSDRALEFLRQQALPSALGPMPGVTYAVAGKTAVSYDFNQQLGSRTPLVFAFVLVLGFVLLAVTLHSVAVSLFSIALNLLSVGAAYGLVTWIFQDGHLSSVLGFRPYGGVTGWLPLFMFVLLFALSMDYQIFIVSRIRERQADLPTKEAVVAGIGASAGVVTSAAVIMTAVFGVFVTLSAIEYKMLGIGMAAAILLDATVVRGILLPAGMCLLSSRPGKRTVEGARG